MNIERYEWTSVSGKRYCQTATKVSVLIYRFYINYCSKPTKLCTFNNCPTINVVVKVRYGEEGRSDVFAGYVHVVGPHLFIQCLRLQLQEADHVRVDVHVDSLSLQQRQSWLKSTPVCRCELRYSRHNSQCQRSS